MNGAEGIGCCELLDVVRTLDCSGAPFSIVVDVENTVVPYGAPSVHALNLMKQTVVSLGACSHLRCVIFLSNSRRRFPVRQVPGRARSVSISRARKPWTSTASLRKVAPGAPIVAVFGDQPLTDGILAWRLAVPYHAVTLSSSREPLWPRTLRLVGGPLLGLLQRMSRRPAVEDGR